MKITICGGGNLGQALAAVFSSRGAEISILTGHPQEWSKTITAHDFLGKTYNGTLCCVSNCPEKVIPNAQMVLLCLPGHCIDQTLAAIAPFVQKSTPIGSVVGSSGFFWMAKSRLPHHLLFAFQRVPFISRIEEYGRQIMIKGYKKSLYLGTIGGNETQWVTDTLSQLLNQPVELLPHYLEAALTNSNPLLHPCRLFGLLNPAFLHEAEPLFYETWDDPSSELLMACDNEFQSVLKHLPATVQPLSEYYESTDAPSLTRKMQSIEAFKGLTLKMVRQNGLLLPDTTSRYFVEDIPFGLIIIKSIALLTRTETPHMDQVIRRIQSLMHKEYLTDEGLMGKDIFQSGAVQQLGISTLQQLIEL